MKLRLTYFILLFTIVSFAQKEVQPYTYTLSNGEKNSETIIIYASAEAVNSVTFTLKNSKNETLEDVKGKITFKVDPFNEISFRDNLIDAFLRIKDSENKDDAKKYEAFIDIASWAKNNQIKAAKTQNTTEIDRFKNQRNAVQEIRNIYQFFSALIITAFQYDTEPVAGILRYRLDSLVITKKTIQGLSTDLYFKKQAKFIRKHIINRDKVSIKSANESLRDCCRDITDYDRKQKCLEDIHEKIIVLDNNNAITISDYIKNETDGFLRFLRENNKGSFIKNLYEFNQNSRKGLWNKAKPTFKNHAIEKLKEFYNYYELKELEESRFFNRYKDIIEEINQLEKSIKKYDIDISKLDDSIENTTNVNDSIQKIIKIIDEKYQEHTKKFRKFQSDSLSELYKQAEALIKERRKIYFSNTDETETQKFDELDETLQEVRDNIDLKTNNFYRMNPDLIDYDKFNVDLKKFDLNEKIKGNLDDIKKLKKRISDIEGKKKKEVHSINERQNLINNIIIENKALIRRFPLWVFKASEIELDINDGFLEHVKVVGEITKPLYNDDTSEEIKKFFEEPVIKEILNDIYGKTIKFDNDFPYGFSSKSDFADLYKYWLYQSEGKEKKFSLPVSEVVSYFQRHQNDRLDFSPKDQVVRLPLEDTDKDRKVELKKEQSSKILSANIYTDFNGFQEEAENGLAQMEIEKLIPIWTKRLNLGLGRGSNFGFANYVNFNLSWQKINEDDRELQVSKTENLINNETVTDRFVTYLDLVRYENVSVGVDLNVTSFDFPLIKTRIELNAGVHYGRINVVDDIITSVNDTTSTTRELDKTTNMIRVYPDVIVRIRPEERFGGYLRFRPFRTIVPNNEEFFAVSSAEGFENRRGLSKSWLHRYELGASYSPSANSDNKFFFRYRYTNTSDFETNGYSEIQLGYQIYLKF